MDTRVERLAEQVGQALLESGLKLTTAESCTGGGIGYAITAVPGSSQWFEEGYITYSNEAKHKLLAVQNQTLSNHGAVSEAVVKEMAQGALTASGAQLAVAVSGVAGPDGGTPEKPVGTVWIGWAQQGKDVVAQQFLFSGDRKSVRIQTVEAALSGVLALVLG